MLTYWDLNLGKVFPAGKHSAYYLMRQMGVMLPFVILS